MYGDFILNFTLLILGGAAFFAILYFVVKAAVAHGIKEAYNDLNVYLRLLITAGIREASEEMKKEQENHE